MISIMRVRAETPPGFTGVAETPSICMEVVEMTSFYTGVAETPPDRTRVAGTPTFAQKNWSGLMTMSEKDTLEVVGSNLESNFYKDATCLCGIGKDVAHYVLNKPRGVILPLMSKLILTVARPPDFRLVHLLYAVLSAVISCFICSMQYFMQ